MKLIASVLLLFSAFAAYAQSPTPIPVSNKDTKIKILEAKVADDEAAAHIKDLESQYTQAQAMIQRISAEYPTAKAQSDQVHKKLADEVDAAYKEAGYDKTKYDFDLKSTAFLPKPVPPVAPPVDKK